MENFGNIGKFLVIAGALIMILGLIFIFYGKIPFLGKLPGDINLRGRNWAIHFPIVTSIIISIILSIILYLVRRFF